MLIKPLITPLIKSLISFTESGSVYSMSSIVPCGVWDCAIVWGCE